MKLDLLISGVRLESKELVMLEVVDDKTSKPPIVNKVSALRLGVDEYEQLGEPTVNKRLDVTITVQAPATATPQGLAKPPT